MERNMENNDRHFSTSVRSEENGDSDFAAQSADEKTEPGVGTEPVTPTETTPAAPLEETDCQHPDASALTSVEAAATTPFAALADQRRPRLDLLEHQLNTSVTRDFTQETESRLKKGAIDLYFSLAPRDAIDSMLASAMVALSNATMDCFDRANCSGRARELNLRYGIKGAATLADLSELYDSRRGKGEQTVPVSKVNVEADGHAIVGNVDSRDRRKRATKSKSTRAPRPQRATPKRRQD
jgi:hypothetical protein